MLPPLTPREKRILFFIRLWQFKRRYSPSSYDIAKSFVVPPDVIKRVIKGLKKKGYIEMDERQDWRKRVILFPRGTLMPWGSDELPNELFDHMPKHPDNGKTTKD